MLAAGRALTLIGGLCVPGDDHLMSQAAPHALPELKPREANWLMLTLVQVVLLLGHLAASLSSSVPETGLE